MHAKRPFCFVLWGAVLSVCSSAIAQTPAGGAVIEVPFEFYRASIIVHAKVAGHGPFAMLLDTGVDPSVIDLKTAKDIGLKLASKGQQPTGGGTDVNLSYETTMPSVTIDGLSATQIDALAVDLSKTSEALGKPILGVLGYSLLKHRIVQIDYPKRVVRFYDRSPYGLPGRSPNNSNLTTLSFRYQDDILLDGVMANGKKLIANLDTGSNANFQLTPAAVSELGLDTQVANAPATESVGANGVMHNRKGSIESITLGNISVAAPNVVFYSKGSGHDHEAWGIRIGNDFCKDFVVTIDYQNSLVTFERP